MTDERKGRPRSSLVPGPVSSRPTRPSTSPPAPGRRPSQSVRIAGLDFDIVTAARRILEGSLTIVPGDNVVMILDRARATMADVLGETARSIGAKCEVVVLEDLGPRPHTALSPEIRKHLADAQASVLLVGFERGEQPMRIELLHLVAAQRLRHAHMVGVTRRSLIAGFAVDPKRILDATRALRMRLRPDSTVKVQSRAGTDLTITLSPRHRWAEQVGAIRPGKWENLPAGELTTSPARVDGTYVADASVGGHFEHLELLTRTPVRLTIEASQVHKVECDDPLVLRSVEAYLTSDALADRVGTIAFGTNVGIVAPIGEIVCDQNMPGLHVSLGATFPELTGAPEGAKTQLTLTAQGLDVDLDGQRIMHQGRYVI
jgi:leucyl aminopeptidase (aminopeptidase T)